MAYEIKETTSYAGRQLDLECLQTMKHPTQFFVEMTPSATYDTPKIVAGPQKLAQRYVVLFTTVTGSDIMNPRFGTDFIGRVDHGNFGGYVEVRFLADEANRITKQRIKEDDRNSAVYGDSPADERLRDSWITNIEVSKADRKIRVHISILTEAGNSIEFVVPTKAGIY
jgi:hypothetical protein